MNTNQDTTLTNQDEFEKWLKENYPDYPPPLSEAWQAATQASEIEINSLKECVEELQADNTIMRDTLNKIALGHVYDADIIESAGDCLQRLCTTQSLAEHDNEVLSKVISLLEDMNANGKHTLPDYIEAIRALKVTP